MRTAEKLPNFETGMPHDEAVIALAESPTDLQRVLDALPFRSKAFADKYALSHDIESLTVGTIQLEPLSLTRKIWGDLQILGDMRGERRGKVPVIVELKTRPEASVGELVRQLGLLRRGFEGPIVLVHTYVLPPLEAKALTINGYPAVFFNP